MIGNTNVGGMSVAQAMVKGTADATITAEKILKGEIGYGKDGERITGTYEGRRFATWTFTQSQQQTTIVNQFMDCGFHPSVVFLWSTASGNGILNTCGCLSKSLFPPVGDTSSMFFGKAPLIRIEETSSTYDSQAYPENIINNGFRLNIGTYAGKWLPTYATAIKVLAIE